MAENPKATPIVDSKGQAIAAAVVYEFPPETKAAVANALEVPADAKTAIITVDRSQMDGMGPDVWVACSVEISINGGATYGGTSPQGGASLGWRFIIDGSAFDRKRMPEVHASLSIPLPKMGQRFIRFRYASPDNITVKAAIDFK